MSIAREMIAAGPGCAVANGLLNGFETTKVKLQLHNNNNKSSNINIYGSKPTTASMMKQIIHEDGLVRGLLTPGLSASLTRSMVYGAYRVGLYSTARDILGAGGSSSSSSEKSENKPTLKHRMISGMGTGAVGAILTCPLDVVRTRMQADAGTIVNGKYITGLRKGLPVRYNTLFSTIITIIKEEGLKKGLYRGSSVTVIRASILNGSQLASYDTLKQHAQLNWWKEEEEGPILHIFCALLSGIIAQTVIMPIDTIKSTMMVGNSWKHVIHKLFEVTKENPIKWLYRGYLPACCGQGMIMVMQMPLIEKFRSLLGVKAI